MADAAFTEAHATLAAAGGGSTFNALGGAFAEPSPPLSQPPPPPPDNRNQWTVTCRAVQLFCSIVVFACTAGSDAYLDGQTSAEFTVLASVSLGLYCSTVLFLELYAASYSITSLAEADAATLYVADRAMLFWFYTGTVCVSTVVSTCESPCHSVRAASAFSFIACAALLVSIWGASVHAYQHPPPCSVTTAASTASADGIVVTHHPTPRRTITTANPSRSPSPPRSRGAAYVLATRGRGAGARLRQGERGGNGGRSSDGGRGASSIRDAVTY